MDTNCIRYPANAYNNPPLFEFRVRFHLAPIAHTYTAAWSSSQVSSQPASHSHRLSRIYSTIPLEKERGGGGGGALLVSQTSLRATNQELAGSTVYTTVHTAKRDSICVLPSYATEQTPSWWLWQELVGVFRYSFAGIMHGGGGGGKRRKRGFGQFLPDHHLRKGGGGEPPVSFCGFPHNFNLSTLDG